VAEDVQLTLEATGQEGVAACRGRPVSPQE
jgi:hypothetical protein